MLQYELMRRAEGDHARDDSDEGEKKFENEVEVLELFKEQVEKSLQQLSVSRFKARADLQLLAY